MKKNSYNIHQSLHGYADGHRRIASSIKLLPADEKTVLQLSDNFHGGKKIPPEGYLTGYPLIESGVYALARTWAAPEMPRPGCVWTHTLYIDFTDLAGLHSCEDLLSQFIRPSGYNTQSYNLLLSIFDCEGALEKTESTLTWAYKLIEALYEHPHEPANIGRPVDILGRSIDVDFEKITLQAWLQQWPKLRRSFRFTTYGNLQNSLIDLNFDLKILSGEDKRANLETHTITSPKIWVTTGVADLFETDKKFRQFLKSNGTDAPGREAYETLCNLYWLQNFVPQSTSSIESMIALLEDQSYSLKAAKLRQEILRKILSTKKPTKRTLAFLSANWSLAKLDNNSGYSEFFKNVVHTSPDILASMLLEKQQDRDFLSIAIEGLTLPELTQLIVCKPVLLHSIFPYRPTILTVGEIWRHIDDLHDIFEVITKENEEFQLSALETMIDSDLPKLAPIAFDIFDWRVIWNAIKSVYKNNPRASSLDKWMEILCSDSSILVEVLSDSNPISTPMLSALSSYCSPSDRFISALDPWLTAIRNIKPRTGIQSDPRLLHFILARFFAKKESSLLPLASLTFDMVYEHHLKYEDNEHWRTLEPWLPSSGWYGRNKCERLRLAVCSLVTDKDWPFAVIDEITHNDSIFKDIINELAETSSGKKILALSKNSKNSLSSSRNSIINDFVRNVSSTTKKSKSKKRK